MSSDLQSTKSLSDINILVQEKFGKNITLTKNELFLVSGFINEKGFSFFSNDFYIIRFKDSSSGEYKNQVITSIEGIRKGARQIGDYGLQFNCIFKDGSEAKVPLPNKELYAVEATITTIFNGVKLEKSKSVLLSEYTTGKNLWRTKPFVMLSKVAEATILRASFNLQGMYVAEEFQNSSEPKEVYSQETKPVFTDSQLQDRKENVEIQKKRQGIMSILKTQAGLDKEGIDAFIQVALGKIGVMDFKSLENINKLEEYVSQYIQGIEIQASQTQEVAESYMDDDGIFEDNPLSTGEYGND